MPGGAAKNQWRWRVAAVGFAGQKSTCFNTRCMLWSVRRVIGAAASASAWICPGSSGSLQHVYNPFILRFASDMLDLASYELPALRYSIARKENRRVWLPELLSPQIKTCPAPRRRRRLPLRHRRPPPPPPLPPSLPPPPLHLSSSPSPPPSMAATC